MLDPQNLLPPSHPLPFQSCARWQDNKTFSLKLTAAQNQEIRLAVRACVSDDGITDMWGRERGRRNGGLGEGIATHFRASRREGVEVRTSLVLEWVCRATEV